MKQTHNWLEHIVMLMPRSLARMRMQHFFRVVQLLKRSRYVD